MLSWRKTTKLRKTSGSETAVAAAATSFNAATPTSNVVTAATPQTMIIESLNAMKRVPSQETRAGYDDDDTSGKNLI